jgi:hypothetical protein
MDGCLLAKIYFMSKDEAGNSAPTTVPSMLKLYEIDCGSRVLVPVCDNTWYIGSTSDYELRNGATVLLSLTVENQQTIRTVFKTSIMK